jgi:HEAT repeat protein
MPWVLGLMLLALVGWIVSTPPVPTHGGRTAREWLAELTTSDPARKRTALNAFAEMGRQPDQLRAALPVLVHALEARDSTVETLVLWIERQVPALGLRVKASADLRLAALEALEQLREVSALPVLIWYLESSPNTAAVDDALRAKAAAVLGGFEAEAEPAVPVLLNLVRADVRGGSLSARAALEAVNRIGGARECVGPTLVECLQSGDERLRRLAAAGLGRWGADAAFAMRSLRQALWTPDASVFPEVAMALGAIGRAAGDAAPELIRGLRHERAMVRATAALNLARVGSDPALAVPALAAALKDEDAYVRSRSAWALGQLGAAAVSAADDLASALHDENEAVQISVIEALGAIGPGAVETVPELERARSNRQAGLGRYVVVALERIESE